MNKILFMISDSKNGGAQVNMVKYFKGFLERGYDVTLICPPGWLYDQVKTGGGRVICSKVGLTKLFFLKKTIKQISPDVICTQLFGTALIGGLCAKLSHINKVFFILNNPIFYDKMSFLKRTTFPTLTKVYNGLCTKFLVKSELVQTQLLGIIGNQYQAKVQSIKNGVDFEKFNLQINKQQVKESLGINPNTHIILSIGRLSPEKGYDVLIKAATACLIARKDLHFLIAGEGELMEKIQSKITENHLQEYITLLGYRSDTPFLLAGCDLFVLPSYFEGLPNSLMEAMAMAKPTVATNVGGVSELLQQGKNGLIVESGDEKAIAKHILHLLSDEETCKQLGENARQFMLDHYEMGKVIEELITIFEN